jgi:hypothetical protein
LEIASLRRLIWIARDVLLALAVAVVGDFFADLSVEGRRE